jgi:hypothetical protein
MRHRRLKIEGGAYFYTCALADRGGDPLIRFGEWTRGRDAELVIGPRFARTRRRLCRPYAC